MKKIAFVYLIVSWVLTLTPRAFAGSPCDQPHHTITNTSTGSVLGALVGSIAGRGRGAIIGAAVGAGGGYAVDKVACRNSGEGYHPRKKHRAADDNVGASGTAADNVNLPSTMPAAGNIPPEETGRPLVCVTIMTRQAETHAGDTVITNVLLSNGYDVVPDDCDRPGAAGARYEMYLSAERSAEANASSTRGYIILGTIQNNKRSRDGNYKVAITTYERTGVVDKNGSPERRVRQGMNAVVSVHVAEERDGWNSYWIAFVNGQSQNQHRLENPAATALAAGVEHMFEVGRR